MKITSTYTSGKEFGTSGASQNYITALCANGAKLCLEFTFTQPPQGKSDPRISTAKIRSLKLELSKEEAMRLAASIIAQEHHPSCQNVNLAWMPPENMPELPSKTWKNRIVCEFDSYHNCISVHNKSTAHLGVMRFHVSYEIVSNKESEEESEQRLIEVDKAVDLAPGTYKEFALSAIDVPDMGCESFLWFNSVEPTRATGLKRDYFRTLPDAVLKRSDSTQYYSRIGSI